MTHTMTSLICVLTMCVLYAGVQCLDCYSCDIFDYDCNSTTNYTTCSYPDDGCSEQYIYLLGMFIASVRSCEHNCNVTNLEFWSRGIETRCCYSDLCNDHEPPEWVLIGVSPVTEIPGTGIQNACSTSIITLTVIFNWVILS
ncbi:uncharacterized protein LOC144363067 [Saccoglossus kowalevskii]